MTSLDQIVLRNFPTSEVSLAFGYGSKVIVQAGSNNDSLIDLIFVVNNSSQWHEANLARNEHHYSFLRYLPNSVDYIVDIQENYGSQIFYNPYVNIDNVCIKYGVIKRDHLIEDLLDWKHLYVAGRLHKPVEFLINTCDKDDKLRSALRFNKESAIRAALLQLPERFGPEQLYELITGLSYHGDLRMHFGEDRNKIKNIVTKQMARFEQLYLPVLRMSPMFQDGVQWHDGKKTFMQDQSSKNIFRHLRLLPKNLRLSLCDIHGKAARSLESEVVLSSISKNVDCDKIVANALAAIVKRSSLTQSFKGLMTAGLSKSLQYTNRKIFKALSSRLSRPI